MKLKHDLLFIVILNIALILVIYFLPNLVLRVILGLPALFLSPGYTLIRALFPKKGVDATEMLALSFGLSILLVAFIRLILNCTSWGIQLNTILTANIIFTTIFQNSLVQAKATII